MQETLILVVDDMLNWRRALEMLLSNIDYSCDVASSKEEAIEMLSNKAYKLAILDIRLDKIDECNQGGIDIVNWLVDTKSHTKAIIMTGYATVEHARNALLSGVVVGFIEKSQIDKLLESVQKAMQSS